MGDSESPVSMRTLFSDLREGNNEFEICADAKELKQIAERYELLEARSFSANLTVRIWKKTGIEVSGVLNALVVQECVATLRPVENSIDTDFTVHLVPEDVLHKYEEQAESDGAIEISLEETDPPDSFNGSAFDLGEIVMEQFGLSLDPFPRTENADFEEFLSGISSPALSEPNQSSPFAELAKLKLQK